MSTTESRRASNQGRASNMVHLRGTSTNTYQVPARTQCLPMPAHHQPSARPRTTAWPAPLRATRGSKADSGPHASPAHATLILSAFARICDFLSEISGLRPGPAQGTPRRNFREIWVDFGEIFKQNLGGSGTKLWYKASYVGEVPAIRFELMIL